MIMSEDPRILIVEDDSDFRNLVKMQLEKQGYQVYEACNGNEALSQAIATEPDVILLDLGLPDMDGLEVLKRYKLNEKSCNIPVIIISNRNDAASIVEGLDHGAVDYISKPFDHYELMARIRATGRTKKAYDTFAEVNRLLTEARKQADTATRSKSEFLANMSHEIRTPLTAIVGYSDLVYQALDDRPDIQKDVRVIRNEGKHMLDLINDILDLAKVEAGRMDFEQIDCSVIEIVSEVTSILRVRAVEKGIELNTHYIGKIPRSIRSDPTRIRQALINLVGNATKFTPSGSVAIEVQLIEHEAKPYVRFKVIDTGIGIKPDRLQNIFEPFNQADSSTTRHHGGTGLGLAITKRIADALQGSINVESVVNQGTTFTFCVPTGPLENTEMVDGPNAVEARHNTNRNEGPQNDFYFEGKVLLAEDTPTNQKLIQRVLQSVGLAVDIADDGKRACEAVRQQDYDIIIMDIHMPNMDGVEAARVIRQFKPDIPIIALTADAMRKARDKCLRSGFNGYLTKPIALDDLFNELSLHIQRIPKPPESAAVIQLDDPYATPAARPSDSEGSTSSRLINPEQAMQRLQMDLETYLELLTDTLSWIKQQQEALNRATNKDDTESIAFAAHAIKSASGEVGLKQLYTAAQKLELAVEERQKGDIKHLFDDLNNSIAEATGCINEYLAQHEEDSQHETFDTHEQDGYITGEASRGLEQLKAQLLHVVRSVETMIS